ncbi:predicted protein, partial [Nematostella vectensis]
MVSSFPEYEENLHTHLTMISSSTGRGWVLNNAKSPQHCHHIMEYILKKCFAPGLTFPNKLHLVYIINDIVHHAARKNLTDLNSAVKEVVVPVFCYARQGDIGEGMQKLTKVLGIWETNDFFDAATLQKLKNPESAKAEVEEVQKRLSQAVEAFYSPPSHESPRNADGWEQSGLFEFYKAKLPFLKQRDLTKKDRPVPPSTPPKKTSPDQSRSRSRSPRSHRSTSRSPRRRHSPSVSPPYRRRSRSRSPQRQRSCSRSRSRSKSRSISPMFRSSDRKSPSPPAFSPFVTKTTETRLDETNVGHQMLKKMGWEGAGLGKNERGIQNPIQAGEVRERHNMYKGIGVEEDDVFDKFRYKRSYTYNRPDILLNILVVVSAVGSVLYLFGGSNFPEAEDCLDGLYAYDIGTLSWELCPTQGRQPKMLGQTTVAIGDTLYVFGGIYRGEANNKLYMLNTGNLTWTPLVTSGQIPPPRCDHACTVIGEKFYISGGSGGEKTWFNDLYCFDTVTLIWHYINAQGHLPFPRSLHTICAYHDKDIYLFGGTNDSAKGRSPFNDVFKFNLSKSKWKKLHCEGPMPDRRLGHCAIIIYGQMIVFGGMNDERDFSDVVILQTRAAAKQLPPAMT